MKSSVIGAGAMGRAVARQLARTGETLLLADRDPRKAYRVACEVSDGVPGLVLPVEVGAALGSELMVLALSHRDMLELAAAERGRLAGKVVVDVANPLDASGTGVSTPAGTSAAELLAATIPDASVVKAFNTACAPALYTGKLDGMPLDVFVASDDEDAKLAVIELVDRAGLRGFDMGPLCNARRLEGLAALSRELQERLGLKQGAGFKFLPYW